MTDAALTVRDLHAWYGTAQALFGVDLDVHRGEIVGLLGRNGAGKTTCFRSIMRSSVRATGTVKLSDVDVSSKRTDAIARQGVAWVPEDRRVFPDLTVEENFHLAAKGAGKKDYPREMILDALPLLGPLMRRRGNQLSGGEQQAVAVGRALAADPVVMLLDEPTEGLAPVIVDQLETAIARLPGEFGVSIILAEQNLPFVLRMTSRVFVLETGRLVHSATTGEFSGASELQERFLSVASGDVP